LAGLAVLTHAECGFPRSESRIAPQTFFSFRHHFLEFRDTAFPRRLSITDCKKYFGLLVFVPMKMTRNRLLVAWLPTTKVGAIHMPKSHMDYWNSDSVKMYAVLAAGPGRVTRKGVFVANEVQAGDNVIVDGRTSRPEPLGRLDDNRFIINNPEEIVIAVCPRQAA
jgi:co-chaperonin GroES (HSP10)